MKKRIAKKICKNYCGNYSSSQRIRAFKKIYGPAVKICNKKINNALQKAVDFCNSKLINETYGEFEGEV
jgi:hypothetical protein